MKFNVLTLFPEMFEPLNYSIIERASRKNLIDINLINIRDFSKDKHKKVDDTPYGGGAGMVVRADVVYDVQDTEEYIEENLSLDEVEKEMIRKALERHHGKRKNAANDLKISERTLYRKIKEYGLE